MRLDVLPSLSLRPSRWLPQAVVVGALAAVTAEVVMVVTIVGIALSLAYRRLRLSEAVRAAAEAEAEVELGVY